MAQSAEFLDTDSDDQIPAGWEERVEENGSVYYANHETEQTQWTHPISGKKKVVKGKLPYGWERKTDGNGGIYFEDKINNRTTYTDPRLAFAQEDRKPSRTFKQKFDGSSTALEVLHGHDLSDKYVIVTGASSGIGVETVRSLAFHGAHVVMACRDLELTESVKRSVIKERPDVHLIPMHLELSSLTSVKKFAEEYLENDWPLHLLILNAGIMQALTITADGLDLTFQVNFFSHFLLTLLLKEKLIANRGSRVIHVSSESHRYTGYTLSEEKVNDWYTNQVPSLNTLTLYGVTKLCNVVFCKELHRRWGKEYGLLSVCLHPGTMIPTKIGRSSRFLKFLFFITRPFTKSLQQGAATTVYCAVSPDITDAGGEYFNNCCLCDTSDQSNRPELAIALWDCSYKFLKQQKYL